MTDAEKYVRHFCPEAQCSGPCLNGKRHPDGWWSIYASPVMSGPMAKPGKTEIEAWANAANKIELSLGAEQKGTE